MIDSLELVQRRVSLAPYTTLGVGGSAEYFAAVSSAAELQAVVDAARAEPAPLTILAGGSNVLIPDEGLSGMVVKVDIRGITVEEGDETVYVTVGAGEHFDELIAWTVEQGWWGLENLSAIPGSVGATPVQNVGAYGVEVSELIAAVRAFDLVSGEVVTFTPAECQFDYRDSFFKREAGSRYVVTAVTFTLSQSSVRRLEYRDLAELAADASQAKIRSTVRAVRAQKFPDWHTIGTAGSFFKNPVVAREQGDALLARHPELPLYPVDTTHCKLSLGFILDRICGLRGYREGNVGLYEQQALVLVNYGGATAAEIDAFATNVAQQVYEQTGLTIEREVRWLTPRLEMDANLTD